MKKTPQWRLILNYLQDGGSLTPLDALRRFNCFALAARIGDIKGMGYRKNIQKEMVEREGKHVAKYSFEANP